MSKSAYNIKTVGGLLIQNNNPIGTNPTIDANVAFTTAIPLETNVGTGRHWKLTNGLGISRWSFSLTGVEQGNNSGSDLTITSYDDAGNSLATPMMIDRATSLVTFVNGGGGGGNSNGVINTVITNITNTMGSVIPASSCLATIIQRDMQISNQTDTLPTFASLQSTFPMLEIGSQWYITYVNMHLKNAIKINAGSGGTLVNKNNVPPNSVCQINFYIQSSTSYVTWISLY